MLQREPERALREPVDRLPSRTLRHVRLFALRGWTSNSEDLRVSPHLACATVVAEVLRGLESRVARKLATNPQ